MYPSSNKVAAYLGVAVAHGRGGGAALHGWAAHLGGRQWSMAQVAAALCRVGTGIRAGGATPIAKKGRRLTFLGRQRRTFLGAVAAHGRGGGGALQGPASVRAGGTTPSGKKGRRRTFLGQRRCMARAGVTDPGSRAMDGAIPIAGAGQGHRGSGRRTGDAREGGSGKKGYRGERESAKNHSAYQVPEYSDASGGIGPHVILELPWESAAHRIET